MFNLQLAHLKFLASEHPEQVGSLLEKGFKDKLLEATAQLLFLNDSGQTESETIRKTRLESLDMNGVAINIEKNYETEVVPEIIGLYEDADKLVDIVKGLKFKSKEQMLLRQNSEREKQASRISPRNTPTGGEKMQEEPFKIKEENHEYYHKKSYEDYKKDSRDDKYRGRYGNDSYSKKYSYNHSYSGNYMHDSRRSGYRDHHYDKKKWHNSSHGSSHSNSHSSHNSSHNGPSSSNSSQNMHFDRNNVLPPYNNYQNNPPNYNSNYMGYPSMNSNKGFNNGFTYSSQQNIPVNPPNYNAQPPNYYQNYGPNYQQHQFPVPEYNSPNYTYSSMANPPVFNKPYRNDHKK